MPNCEKCNKHYHYCCSCSTERCCENGFCSDDCMYSSDEYLGTMDNLKKLLKSFDNNQLIRFFEFVDVSYKYEYEIEEFIEDYKNDIPASVFEEFKN